MRKILFLGLMIVLLAAACNTAQPTSKQNQPIDNEASKPQEPVAVTKVKVFVIAPDDNGKTGKLVGCGDSVIGIDREVSATTAPLKVAIETLLAIKDKYIGQSGLYNSLAGSNLKVDSVAITNGNAVIKLSGTMTLGGMCDDPRFKSQLEETALQFPSVKTVSVFIGNQKLDEILSAKGPVSTVKVYFAAKNSSLGDCNEVVAVERTVNKTVAVGTAAINELLKGPTAAEKASGLGSSFPAGSKFNSLKIVDGVAYADFNQATEMGGGSCAQTMVTTQIKQTLLQFPTVITVKLSVEGQSNPLLIFQP